MKPGQMAPDFTLQTLEGKTISLQHLKGQPVVLVFWASWCSICNEEFPLINRVFQQRKLKRVYLISATDSEKKVRVFFKTHVYPGLVPLLTGHTPAVQVARKYQVSGQPTMVFINASGRIEKVHSGAISTENLLQILKML
ncbi:thioredoxin-like protein YneN [Deinococcus roseus]|uniref:Thioredoxin-like protein YneN n=1 Tax=Deinococcus roseus TaxID=392414 RepID=A0ABQ2CYY5_9DEIO|nr:thioredoxin-like protein YneN [Deinococcus roseus]